jgi:hypothetical protein
MSLAKIASAKRKRKFYGGGDADPEGTADASRADGSPSVGGFNPDGGWSANDSAQFGTPTAPAGTGAPYSGGDTGGTATATPTAAPSSNFLSGLTVEGVLGALGRMPGGLGMLSGLASKGIAAAKQDWSARENDSAQFGIPMPSRGQDNGEGSMGSGLASDAAANPFGSSAPTQTTPTAPADAGMRKYVWDPVARQYTLTNVGAGANPMGYTSGQTFKMAAGGQAPSGIAAGAPLGPRFVQGGGTGLSDDVPVKMDDGGEGRLADGEFVIPADVVSGLGGGSSKAGADILYQMMERIRQMAHGKSEQVRPVDPGKALPV